jgi:amino acid transporter
LWLPLFPSLLAAADGANDDPDPEPQEGEVGDHLSGDHCPRRLGLSGDVAEADGGEHSDGEVQRVGVGQRGAEAVGASLALEGASMLLVIIACAIIVAKGGFHGHAFSPAPFRPDGVPLPVLGLGIVLTFGSFSGFEAAATLGEESRQPRRLIPPAIAASLAVAAIYAIGVAAVVTNAYPGITQLSQAPVPLVTVTGTYVAGWMGELVNIGAVVSLFGASLACVVGASRILFALGRYAGPVMLARTSRATGAPVGALI